MFITFEGGEGAGKTTLIHRIASYLEEKGKRVLLTREPGGTPLGEEIRALLLQKKEGLSVGVKAELLLFLAARAEHVERVIRPALEEGITVLCDRFHDSTFAYQVGGRGLPFKEVESLALFASSSLCPDYTFFIDVDPEEGLRRTERLSKKEASIGDKDRMESLGLSFHEKVRAFFLATAEKERERFFVLDGMRSKDEVFSAAIKHLEMWK